MKNFFVKVFPLFFPLTQHQKPPLFRAGRTTVPFGILWCEKCLQYPVSLLLEWCSSWCPCLTAGKLQPHSAFLSVPGRCIRKVIFSCKNNKATGPCERQDGFTAGNHMLLFSFIYCLLFKSSPTSSRKQEGLVLLSFDFLHVTLQQTQEPPGRARFLQPEKDRFLCSWGAVLTIVENVSAALCAQQRLCFGEYPNIWQAQELKVGSLCKTYSFSPSCICAREEKQANKQKTQILMGSTSLE